VVPDGRYVPGVGDANRIGGGPGGLEGVRHGERDVLAVIANDVVLEWRAPLLTNAFKSGSRNRTVDLADVPAVENSSHAGHFLGGGGVEFDHAAAGDGRLDGHGIQQSGKVEVGGVLRHP